MDNGLAGIPSHAYYRLNTSTPANPQDSRAMGSMIRGGAGTRRHHHRLPIERKAEA